MVFDSDKLALVKDAELAHGAVPRGSVKFAEGRGEQVHGRAR